MEYDLTLFEKGLEELGIALSQDQKKQFITYYEYLVEKNKVMNLTAITDFDEVVEETFCRISVSLIQVVDLHQPLKVNRSWNWCGVSGNPIKNCFSGIKCGAG